MKRALLLLLCLLSGCKEIDLGNNSEKREPDICPDMHVPMDASEALTAFVPTGNISVSVLKSGKQYQIWLENVMLWDECTRSSDRPSAVTYTPYPYLENGTSVSGSNLEFKTYFGDLLSSGNPRVRIFELDASCQPTLPAAFDQMVGVQVTVYSDKCYSSSSQSLNVRF